MKSFILSAGILLYCLAAPAQSTAPIKWTFTVQKTGTDIYQVHLTATLSSNWHIYAQNSGEGPIPTHFIFAPNPLLILVNKPKEVGKLKKAFEPAFKSEVQYYEKTVDFVQTVQVKGHVKTMLTGKVEFLLCRDMECLPPDDLSFSVDIGG